jgi:hypothetical protein
MTHPHNTSLTSAPDPARRRGPRGLTAGVRPAGAGVLVAASLLVVGCGSAAPTRAHAVASVSGPVATASATTAAAVVNTKGAKSEGRVAKSIRRGAGKPNERRPALQVTRGNVVQRPFVGTGGNTANDDNPTGTASRSDSGPKASTASTAANPCLLVSRSQAESITGHAVKVTEAPLGPTCIYQEKGAKASITLAVQRQKFSSLKRNIKHLSKYTIRHKAAYCGVYGTSVLDVPLGSNRLLNITAPCSVARKFAAVALAKLG